MRVISQDGTMSIDFDRNAFSVREKFIYVMNLGLKTDTLIGKYDSASRANEVFGEMHTTYRDEQLNLPDVCVYQLPRL